ncbi:hypothetical protein PA0111 [Candidatus Phytoplasma australiense]|uniref:DUF2963 domain-containing protein n=1 Tax=Phytoplasma australiense TaxID=59748 RepID=B1V914_PHYAS|nr:hypothetical protein PA0111 [Candidatus Phytoplasma australiense]
MFKKIIYIILIIIFFISILFVYHQMKPTSENLIPSQTTNNLLPAKNKVALLSKAQRKVSLKQDICVYEPFANPNLKFYDENHQEITKLADFDNPLQRCLFLNQQKVVYGENQKILSSRFLNPDNTIKWDSDLTFNMTYDNENYPSTKRSFNDNGSINWQSPNTYDTTYNHSNGRVSSQKMFNLDGTVNWQHPDTFERFFNEYGLRIKERHFKSDGTIDWANEETFDIKLDSKNKFLKTIYFNENGEPLQK